MCAHAFEMRLAEKCNYIHFVVKLVCLVSALLLRGLIDSVSFIAMQIAFVRNACGGGDVEQ